MRGLLHTLFYVNLLLWLENKNHMSGIKWLRVPQTDGAFDGADGSGDTFTLTERRARTLRGIFQDADRCGSFFFLFFFCNKPDIKQANLSGAVTLATSKPSS